MSTYGQEMESKPSYVDDGTLATSERIATARSHWHEGKAEDFQQVGQRKWVDRATGHAFRHKSAARR